MDEEEHAEEVQSLDRLPEGVAAVGHRVVHGGRFFGDAASIDAETIDRIRALASLAPLHTAPALRGIAAAQAALGSVPHVAVFDSAFHRTIPDEASTYAIPKSGARSGGYAATASTASRSRPSPTGSRGIGLWFATLAVAAR